MEQREEWFYFKADCLFARSFLVSSKNISKHTHAITDVIMNLTHCCQGTQPVQFSYCFFLSTHRVEFGQSKNCFLNDIRDDGHVVSVVTITT